MLSRIKGSLNRKVFFLVFIVLTICSMLIYGVVMAVLPKQYQFEEDQQLNTNAEIFALELKGMNYNDGIKAIYNFCIQNNCAAVLISENQTLSFGEISSDQYILATSNIVINVNFLDRKTDYTFVISSIMRAVDQISQLLIYLLPIIFLIIIFLSILSALICSKIIVSPIARISQISRRMTALDMTCRCD